MKSIDHIYRLFEGSEEVKKYSFSFFKLTVKNFKVEATDEEVKKAYVSITGNKLESKKTNKIKTEL